jgi:hypothetical protein
LSKRIPLATLFVSLLCGTLWAQDLAVHLDGDYLRVSLPHIDFLQGKPLNRLKDGVSVAFIGRVTITSTPTSLTPIAESLAQFALSYDIIQEEFSVTKIGKNYRRSQSHLTAQAAELWCLDNLGIDRSELPSDRPFYVNLDLHLEDPRDEPRVVDDGGISLLGLAERLGRPGRSAQPRWQKSSGPYRLDDLKKFEVKGTRG